MYHQAFKYLSSSGIITNNQFGFFPVRSTTKAQEYLAKLISESFENKSHIRLALWDLTKAFDHNLVLLKLEPYGKAKMH